MHVSIYVIEFIFLCRARTTMISYPRSQLPEQVPQVLLLFGLLEGANARVWPFNWMNTSAYIISIGYVVIVVLELC